MDSGCHQTLLPHEDGSCVQPPDASKPHVRWCGRMPGRNPRHPTRSDGCTQAHAVPGVVESQIAATNFVRPVSFWLCTGKISFGAHFLPNLTGGSNVSLI